MNPVTSPPDDFNHSGVHLLMCSYVHPLMCVVNHSHDFTDRAIFLYSDMNFSIFFSSSFKCYCSEVDVFFFTINTQSDL